LSHQIKPKEGNHEVKHLARFLPSGWLGQVRNPTDPEDRDTEPGPAEPEVEVPSPTHTPGLQDPKLIQIYKSLGLQWLLQAAALTRRHEPPKRPARHFRNVFWWR